ncbi:Protein of unknown function identified by role in sporulation (SpoVG) [Lachnospiraceae bacterium TWA4]|nr:Protein of unknown function identified by role in sporulation (SpoVG) [Lachnospiraceae bacterium TWA4]
MIITSVQMKIIENPTTKMLGVASIVLDDMIVIHDIKILQSEGSKFLAMPSKVLKNGDFKDVAHPINKEARCALEKIIFSCFEEGKKKMCSRVEMSNMNNTVQSLLDQMPEDFFISDFI